MLWYGWRCDGLYSCGCMIWLCYYLGGNELGSDLEWEGNLNYLNVCYSYYYVWFDDLEDRLIISYR